MFVVNNHETGRVYKHIAVRPVAERSNLWYLVKVHLAYLF
jgi:hypothetical protein